MYRSENSTLPATTASRLLRELTDKGRNVNDGYRTPADELIKLRDAGLITDAEARLVVVDMFPQIKRLEDARALLAQNEA